jgi:hypothetical protein
MYLSKYIQAAGLENASVILWISSICISSSTPSRRVLLANPGAERKVAQPLDEVAKTIKNLQRTNFVRRSSYHDFVMPIAGGCNTKLELWRRAFVA